MFKARSLFRRALHLFTKRRNQKKKKPQSNGVPIANNLPSLTDLAEIRGRRGQEDEASVRVLRSDVGTIYSAVRARAAPTSLQLPPSIDSSGTDFSFSPYSSMRFNVRLLSRVGISSSETDRASFSGFSGVHYAAFELPDQEGYLDEDDEDEETEDREEGEEEEKNDDDRGALQQANGHANGYANGHADARGKVPELRRVEAKVDKQEKIG